MTWRDPGVVVSGQAQSNGPPSDSGFLSRLFRAPTSSTVHGPREQENFRRWKGVSKVNGIGCTKYTLNYVRVFFVSGIEVLNFLASRCQIKRAHRGRDFIGHGRLLRPRFPSEAPSV